MSCSDKENTDTSFEGCWNTCCCCSGRDLTSADIRYGGVHLVLRSIAACVCVCVCLSFVYSLDVTLELTILQFRRY